jgi:hypothetical protein
MRVQLARLTVIRGLTRCDDVNPLQNEHTPERVKDLAQITPEAPFGQSSADRRRADKCRHDHLIVSVAVMIDCVRSGSMSPA